MPTPVFVPSSVPDPVPVSAAKSTTWYSTEPPPPLVVQGFGWLRVALRGGALALIVYGGLIVLLLARLLERPLFGQRRPVTPFITQAACRAALMALGLRLRVQGKPMQLPGALVANHASWLDIFALNAAQQGYFVAKSEVAGWPGIGWLARATGTLFIARKVQAAGEQKRTFEARLRMGHRLLFFPEGTSSDGRRVLPFKSTLFAAFFAPELRDVLHIQPVSVVYSAPEGTDPRLYGWWGDMGFAAHMLVVLGAARRGQVALTFHPPRPVSGFADRKALAKYCQATVQGGCGF